MAIKIHFSFSPGSGAVHSASFLASEGKSLETNPGGGGYSHTLPIQVPAAQRGRDFEASDLEWGIHFRGVL